MEVGAPGMPSDPVAAAIPNGVPVASASNSGVAPLHEVVRRLQTRLGNWEGIILRKAERSLMCRKLRGMGLIQHKAKQLRETWGQYCHGSGVIFWTSMA